MARRGVVRFALPRPEGSSQVRLHAGEIAGEVGDRRDHRGP